MALKNPTWGEERIANELLLKLGIRVAPRTVGKYLGSRRSPSPHGRTSSLRWSTFVRNHAKAMVACDFFVSVTATFRVLYVFVAMEIEPRRIVHTNVTAHPTADWTIQQFPEFLAFDHPCRFLIHDRDGIFSPRLDGELRGFGVRVLKRKGHGRDPFCAFPSEDSGANADSQCLLRKINWHDPPGVPRLPHPGQRATPRADSQRVRMPL
jgi:putative transposase